MQYTAASHLRLRLIGQSFTQPLCLWPRPSAVDYNDAAARGGNLSAANPQRTALAAEQLAEFGLRIGTLVPPELMAASGSELDPHPTLAGALVQAPRIGAAREPLVERNQAALLWRANAMPRGDVELVNMVDANLAWDAREAGELDHGRR